MLVSVVCQSGNEYLNRRFTLTGKKRLGAFLRACRLAHDWSVHQLAEETRRYEAEIYRRRGETSLQSLGVSVSNISRYENGNYEKISFDQLWILLDVLKPLNSQAGKLMGLEDLLMIGTEELNIPLTDSSQSDILA